MEQSEIIIYQPDDKSTKLEVRVEDETVWLTQSQMVVLFSSTKQNISLHVKNIYKEGEFQTGSTVKEYLTVQREGNRQVKRKVAFYNKYVYAFEEYRTRITKN